MGKLFGDLFPVGLREQCQWFVNRCNVTRRTLFLPNSSIYAAVCLVSVSACGKDGGGCMDFSMDAFMNKI